MLRLTNEGIKDRAAWEEKGYSLPKYDRAQVEARTKENPTWIHFGAGNIFRAFQANVCDELLNQGVIDTGKKPIEVYASMKDMEILVGPKFFRCHRGYLVNMEHIHGYSRTSIIMDNGDEIFLSRDRYPAFVAAYEKFL